MKNIGPIARWRTYPQLYRLQGVRCVACQKVYYPQKYLCTCGEQKFEPYTFSGNGTLVTFTKIYHPPERFERKSPYFIGIIMLEHGVKILASLTNVDENDVRIGMPMCSVFRKLYEEGDKGVINYGIMFEPNRFGPNTFVQKR